MILALALMLAAAPDCGALPNTTAMTMCFGREAEAAEVELNATWRRTLAAMKARDADPAPGLPGPTYAQALLESQRAWLAFRSKECVIESYEYRGGSLQPGVENQCMTATTRARVRQLRELVWTR